MSSGLLFPSPWLSDVSRYELEWQREALSIWSSYRVPGTLTNFGSCVVLDSLPEQHVLIFTLSYIAMAPCANLIGFAGQELARKLPHVLGVLIETTVGSIVEIILFMVLLSKDQFLVIKAAILGSILATMLLCLGLCFFVGGLYHEEQSFSDTISEAGSGLLLTAYVILTCVHLLKTS